MPTPPKKRATRNKAKLEKAPVSNDDNKNTMADTISKFFRPILSANHPQVHAPIMQPTNAILIAKPWLEGESAILKYGSQKGFAPPITTQS